MAEQPAGPTRPARSRRLELRWLHLPRPWSKRVAGSRERPAGDVYYQERHHPIWFFSRCWVWLLLFAVALPTTLRAEGRAGQLVGGALVLVSELAILLRLVDWITTQVLVGPGGLEVIGYDGRLHVADLRSAGPRIIQGRLGRLLGYAHLVTRRPGLRPKTTGHTFLTRPDELRSALDTALRPPRGDN